MLSSQTVPIASLLRQRSKLYSPRKKERHVENHSTHSHHIAQPMLISRNCSSSVSLNPQLLPKYAHDCPTSSSVQALELFGYDLSNYGSTVQYLICASGLMTFSLLYGYLQELVSVNIFSRHIPFFFGTLQFGIYSIWSYFLLSLHRVKDHLPDVDVCSSQQSELSSSELPDDSCDTHSYKEREKEALDVSESTVWRSISETPYWKTLLFLSFLKALDMGLTNLSMKFLNYPAKTILKSSRVAFTMLTGIIVGGKSYRFYDFFTVSLMVLGLAFFLHADSSTDTIFHPVGVMLILISMICDGILNNISELLMDTHDINQDEYLFKLYTMAFCFMLCMAIVQNEIVIGAQFMWSRGTMEEFLSDDAISDHDQRFSGWTPVGKMIAISLFGTVGLLGSSCSALIMKRFGALTMSITSTARKAGTLFLSFVIFPENNTCTTEHVLGMILFVTSLVLKSTLSHKKRHITPFLGQLEIIPLNQIHSQSKGTADNIKTLQLEA